MSSLVKSMANSGSRDAANIFIEIGPHSALQGPAQQIIAAISDMKYSYLGPISRGKSSADTFAATAGKLFDLGATLNFQGPFSSQSLIHTPQVIVDLPTYPWDHSLKHWNESRLSRDYRLRPFPYHDLLGLYEVNSPLDEPRWRHHLSVERLPWLRHHIVDGLVIFPGAGYTCMVLEAMKQLIHMQSPGSKISKYYAKSLGIHRPIILPSEQNDGPPPDIEVQLILSPSKMRDNSPWYSVRILSLQADDTWAEHATGNVRVELEAQSDNDARTPGIFGDEGNAAIEEAFEALSRITSLAQEQIDPAVMYEEHRAAGNEWGPSFTLITEAYIGKGVALAKLKTSDMAQWMPKAFYQPHLIHPSTLDASNHMLATLFHKQIVNSPLMPIATNESMFTNAIISTPGEEIVVVTELEPLGKTGAMGTSWTFQHDPATGKLKLVASLRGMELRAIGEEAINGTNTGPFDRKNNYEVKWMEDPNYLTEARFHAMTSRHARRDPEFYERLELNEKAAMIYCWQVRDIPVVKSPETAATPHLQQYSQWMSDFTSSEKVKDVCNNISEYEQAHILEKSLQSGHHEGTMLARIGKNLPAILDNTASSLSLMVEDGFLGTYYKEGPLVPTYKQMIEYFNILTHKNPQMNIIEVGAGTGSATVHLFNALGNNAQDLIRNYCYTDISSGFFEQGRTLLEKWKSLLKFEVLDVTKDPIEQGFEPQYDLVVASNVIHATPSIQETLVNVRKLLKPGGRMLLLEIHRNTNMVSTIFGSLPG